MNHNSACNFSVQFFFLRYSFENTLGSTAKQQKNMETGKPAGTNGKGNSGQIWLLSDNPSLILEPINYFTYATATELSFNWIGQSKALSSVYEDHGPDSAPTVFIILPKSRLQPGVSAARLSRWCNLDPRQQTTKIRESSRRVLSRSFFHGISR